MTLEKLKETICQEVDKRLETLNDISEQIWKNPELGFDEKFAHKLVTDFLEKEGFEVARQTPLPTSFIAKFGKGNGIKVGIVIEYDALPGIGHACGHNLITEAGIGAALGIKAALTLDTLCEGQLLVFGTPAEEGGGGKVLMIEKGAFDDVDFCIMAHPYVEDIIYHPELSLEHLQITYHGRASHASVAPWQGINALDAVVQCYNNISMMRQQILPDCRVHGIITKGGEKPNIIPQVGQLEYFVRGITDEQRDDVKKKVIGCAEAAAIATGCKVEIKTVGHPYSNMLINKCLATLFENNGFQLNLEFKENPPNMVGSTDMGNVSHLKPSIHPMFKIPTKGPNHTKAFTEAAIKPEAQEPTIKIAKCIAMTAIDVLHDKKLLDEIYKGFNAK